MSPEIGYSAAALSVVLTVLFFYLVRKFKQTMDQKYRWPILFVAAVALSLGLFAVAVLVK